MSKCPECKLPHQEDFTNLNCGKCKKKYHWQCTKLEDHIIKQYKYNKYKPWRCQTCVDKYCINCDKNFPQNYQESICCDHCNYWYHFHCSELTVDEFLEHLPENSERWVCKKCTNKICAKCQQNTHLKSRIKCSLCTNTFHKSCTKTGTITDRENWICKQCYITTFPFSNSDNKTLIEMSTVTTDKYSLKNSQTNTIHRNVMYAKEQRK